MRVDSFHPKGGKVSECRSDRAHRTDRTDKRGKKNNQKFLTGAEEGVGWESKCDVLISQLEEGCCLIELEVLTRVCFGVFVQSRNRQLEHLVQLY